MGNEPVDQIIDPRGGKFLAADVEDHAGVGLFGDLDQFAIDFFQNDDLDAVIVRLAAFQKDHVVTTFAICAFLMARLHMRQGCGLASLAPFS